MSRAHKIQQQYYTRAREGIFRTTEGLDTVAKSPSLDNQFIKKTLHPFCVYFPPQELSQRGESDSSKYPESLTVFHADSGELVIGRAIHAGADFTGQRDTIFVHNYIVPQERKEQLLMSVDPIFQIERFESKFEAGNGKELPELDTIPYGNESNLKERPFVLNKLGIDEKRFKQLLWAVMMSISSNKKVFISLDVDVTECARYAKRLTEIIFHFLPYELRRHFGFTTFHNEPQGKKYIDVMFVEKGSIRPGDRSLDREFLFDFANQRFVNVELNSQDNYFLDFAWACRERPDALAVFFAFAEEALQGLDAAKRLAFSTYHQLCALFMIDGEIGDAYVNNKEGVMNSILGYLNTDMPQAKIRLSRLFEKLVNLEASSIQSGAIVSASYLQAMMDYCRLASDRTRREFVGYFVQVLYNNWNNYENPGYTEQVLHSMQGQPDLFSETIDYLKSQHKYIKVFEDYILARAEKMNSVEEIKEEVMFWDKYSSQVLTEKYFLEQCARKVQQVLEKDRNRIKSGEQLNGFAAQLSSKSRKYDPLAERIQMSVVRCVLGQLNLKQLSALEISQLKYLIADKNLTLGLENREARDVRVLRTVTGILEQGSYRADDMENRLDELGSAELELVQFLLKQLLRDRTDRSQYINITYAFYKTSHSFNHPQYDFGEMLSYVYDANPGNEEVYNFMLWLAGKHAADVSFRKAVKQFFRKKASGALKNRKIKKKLLTSRSSSFKALIREIEREQMPPLLRVIMDNWKKIIMAVISVILISIIGIIVWMLMTPGDSGNAGIPSEETGTEPGESTLLPESTDSSNPSVTSSPTSQSD